MILQIKDADDRVFLDGFEITSQVIARILANTIIVGNCWLWQGYLRNGKHGATSINDTSVYIHRIVLAWVSGGISDGLQSCHTCDTSNCIRPDHLFAGTQQANVDDMWAKGRAVSPPVAYGLQNSKAKLTFEQITQIRALGLFGAAKQRELAREFKCSQSTIWRLLHQKTRLAA